MRTETQIRECQDAVFEFTTEWLDDKPNGRKRVTVRQLSGPDRPPEVWEQASQEFIRTVTARGGRVISYGYGSE